MRKVKSLVLALALGSVLITGCKGEKDPETTGTVQGMVTDGSSSAPLGDVKVIIFDANTNAPMGATIVTGANGAYKAALVPGNYYIKLYKQGYDNVPPKEMSALPFSVEVGQVVEQPYQMYKSAVTNGGVVSGKVVSGSSPVGGVLVVAFNGTTGYSSVTDAEGKYSIYNVPVGNYEVKGWVGGYNSSQVDAAVSSNATTTADLALTSGAAGEVTGQLSFLATTAVDVDVALTHPGTRETIPGLSVVTAGSTTYKITGVPSGRYLARATYRNDGRVVDPDWIVKNGEPFVEVSNGSVARNFSLTGAVTINTPTNAPDVLVPVEVSTTPTFTWTAYASTDDYVIEVMDANGKVIWGGFSNNWTAKNISIPKSQTSIQYNADGKATESLVPGKLYRWKIYASKSENISLTGWKLISVSEDQRGLMKVK